MQSAQFSYESEKAYYSRDWPKEAKPYLHLEPYLRSWLDVDSAFAGKRVLDIGAGECTYTRLIADRFCPRQVIACELFRERLLPAVQDNRTSHLSFVTGSAFSLPFQSKSVDVVFGSFILHQLPNLLNALQEVERVLSFNGAYIGIEPNPFNPVHFARFVRGRHSRNQYLLGPRDLKLFKQLGFKLEIRYFWVKLPSVRNRFLATCMGILARKEASESQKIFMAVSGGERRS